MFDPVTSTLIQGAPQLSGLDLKRLPKRLTEAFAQIVATRIRLRAGSLAPDDAEALASSMEELRRLAAALEAHAALLPDRENRASAAFVAASAHQAIALAANISTTSHVDLDSVSPDISATLLFLIAEAHADAAEATKQIKPAQDSDPIATALIVAIRHLAQGRLTDIVRAPLPAVAFDQTQDPQISALQALQLGLLRGIVAMAKRLRQRGDVEGSESSAQFLFQQVKSLCVDEIDGVIDKGNPLLSVFPGPLHLASLLLAVEGDLVGTALARIPTPKGVAEDAWWTVLRRMARTRPYLWRNHRDAIASGYLEHGVSSAISFPTGGGKSTLAELKIATTLLRGQKVIFLAPTHALVGQTTKALKATFKTFDVVGDIDDQIDFEDVYVLPEVSVTTPERCLMLLSLTPDAFSDLGLIVFDECHLLHPREEDRSRRGLDSMLALLNLTQIAPDADLLLLSAMMKNTEEIAGWVNHITGRKCLTLDLAWKPTRQVRGCVVYSSDEIKALENKLVATRASYPNHKKPPVSIARQLTATPYGFFSLLQTWETTNREDYALIKLLENSHPLSTGKNFRGDWHLTPNGNNTSASIAASAVSANLKSLVFLQTTVFCESAVKDFAERVDAEPVALTENEKQLRTLGIEEMGAAEHCYLRTDSDGLVHAGAVSHHSLLLREERELHESLFKRPDGVKALFATSTLAQGMNLPSQIVIISGDSRFDPNANKMLKLEAHELLNAAGRAGRAGESAQGLVLLVPSRVIDFDNGKSQINKHWMALQAIFQSTDQCLVIDDPITGVLDQIHDGITKSGAAAYLLSKLSLTVSSSEASKDSTERLLRKTFAAYRAGVAGDQGWINSRVEAAVAARAANELSESNKWIEHVSSATGLSADLLNDLSLLLDGGKLNGTAEQIVLSLIGWLKGNPVRLTELVRPESLEGMFGKAYKELPTDEQRAKVALPCIELLWPLWMEGLPLCRLEAAFKGSTDKLGYCEYARHFASRIAPDLAFIAGLPARLLAAQRKFTGDDSPMPVVLTTLGAIVREGCSSPECLAARVTLGREISRVSARAMFDRVKGRITAGSETEEFEDTIARVSTAIDLEILDGGD